MGQDRELSSPRRCARALASALLATLLAALLAALLSAVTVGLTASAAGVEGSLEQRHQRGVTLWQRGAYAESLRWLEPALDDARAQRHYEVAAELAADVAALYFDLGDITRGAGVIEAARDLFAHLRDDDAARPARLLAATLHIRAADDGAPIQRLLLDAQRAELALKDGYLEVALRLAQGRSDLTRAHFKDAVDQADLALESARQREDALRQAQALALRGEALLRSGEINGAREAIDASLRLAAAQGYRELIATDQSLLGELDLQSGRDLVGAERHYAVWWAEQQGLWLATEGLDDSTRALYLRRQRPTFDAYFAVLAELHRTAGTVAWAQRAFALAQSMKAGLIPRMTVADGRRVGALPLSAEQDVRRGLAADEALLEYVVTAQSIWAFVLRPQELKLVDLGAPLWARRWAGLLLEQLQAGQDGAIESLSKFEPARAHALFSKVFEPVRALLGKPATLYVAADDFLYALPFGALVTDAVDDASFVPHAPTALGVYLQEYASLHYLADDLAVAYLPAGSALPSLRQREMARSRAWTRPLIAFADPIFAPDDAPTRAGLQRLAASADEARGAARAVGAKAGDLYLRERATLANVRQAPLVEAQYLLFSTHGLLNAGAHGADEPSLLLTPPAGAPAGAPDSAGRLTASQAIQLRLSAQMVVLSACRTGDGGGDGFSGLPRAFLSAGADSVLASLWMVETAATRDLVIGTFRALGSFSRAAALKQAQAEVRFGPPRMIEGVQVSMAHPFFWAGFVLVGLGR